MVGTRKKEEKKELSNKQKWWYTVLVLFFAPVITVCVILHRSFLGKMLTRLNGMDEKEKDVVLEKLYPTNQTKPPYAKLGSKIDPRKDPKNTQDFTTYIADPKKAAAKAAMKRGGIDPATANLLATFMGGGKKKRKKNQRGGSGLGGGTPKTFMSLDNYSFPYNLKDSEYTFLQGLGEYFISFSSENRKFEKKYMTIISDMLYPTERKVPGKDEDKWTKIGWELIDISKLTLGLGLSEIVKLICYAVYNIYLLFFCSFQAGPNPLMWIVCLIFGIITLIVGVGTLGFFPFQFYAILAAGAVFTPDKGKWEFFNQIMNMYKYVWMTIIWLTYGIAIPSIWGWTTKNGDTNWFPIICSWVFPPLIFAIQYLGLGVMPAKYDIV